MVRFCAVKSCMSGRNSDYQNKKISGLRQTSLFKVPKENQLLDKWKTALSQDFKSTDFVCELHFEDKDIIRFDCITMPDGTVCKIKRFRYKLKENAVPMTINNIENEEVTYQSPPRILSQVPAKRSKTNIKRQNSDKTTSVKPKKKKISNKSELLASELEPVASIFIINGKPDTFTEDGMVKTAFTKLYENEISLPLPEGWSKHLISDENCEEGPFVVYSNFVYSNYLKLPVQCKKICLNEDLYLDFYYGNKFIRRETYLTTTQVQQAIESFSKSSICHEGPKTALYGESSIDNAFIDEISNTWRHNDCVYILNEAGKCKPCKSLWAALRFQKYKNTPKTNTKSN